MFAVDGWPIFTKYDYGCSVGDLRQPAAASFNSEAVTLVVLKCRYRSPADGYGLIYGGRGAGGGVRSHAAPAPEAVPPAPPAPSPARSDPSVTHRSLSHKLKGLRCREVEHLRSKREYEPSDTKVITAAHGHSHLQRSH
ncbi:hypothetical protein EVAR_96811_1 [Eumeta japonica]|uniref:Uncharacterized protein n=1 Tax=Eumeta variegata TaxID=151549 RepID=A0A4C1WCL7_EUMVA|nr:hypothetical protein EVAR_96811_1 [Eumeta japonica]